MDNMAALTLARKAREDKVINRYRRDSVTGEVYTVRDRIESGAYAYRTRHVEAGKRDTYGMILASEIDGEVNYMTPVVPVSKIGFDYAADLPVVTFDEDTCRTTLD